MTSTLKGIKSTVNFYIYCMWKNMYNLIHVRMHILSLYDYKSEYLQKTSTFKSKSKRFMILQSLNLKCIKFCKNT